MKITTIIANYLKQHRRLVVPQLGAFIRKSEGEEVVFSEMLKRDDGVLASLLRAEGLGEIEAAGAIDRFVFELRHRIDSGAVFQAEGLGVFARGENNTIRFRHLPTEEPATDIESKEQPQVVPTPQPEPEPQPTPEQIEPEVQAERVAVEKGTEEPATPTPQTVEEPSKEEPSKEPSFDEKRRKIKELIHFEEEHPKEYRSSSQPRRNDPSVKGLRYGAPRKSTDAFTYVNSAPSRRPDTFVILAILAVVIALGAILYGYLKDRKQEQLELQYIEQIASETGGSPEVVTPEQ